MGKHIVLAVLLATLPRACDGGASAYHLLGDVAEELDPAGAIVEVGSDRGEGSTVFLSGLANRTRRPFFSVDFSEEGYLNARRACGTCAHRGMGEEWLEAPEGFSASADAAGMGAGADARIAVAYLDNYDWTYPWTKTMAYKVQQHKDYEKQGLSLSNAKSQETHLRQAIAVEKRCSERCFVLFDDTWAGAAPGLYSGKGGRAVGYLMAKGFEVVQQSSESEPSHLGWVLLRRLPEHERIADAGLSESIWSELRARETSEVLGGASVQVLSPAQNARLTGSVLEISVRVRGAVLGDHTLVVYSQNVEVLRVTNWDDIPSVRLALCNRAVGAPTAAQSEAVGDEWHVCPAAVGGGAAGGANESGESSEAADGSKTPVDASWVEHHELPLLIHSMTPGEKHILLELLDGLHKRVAQVRQKSLHLPQNSPILSSKETYQLLRRARWAPDARRSFRRFFLILNTHTLRAWTVCVLCGVCVCVCVVCVCVCVCVCVVCVLCVCVCVCVCVLETCDSTRQECV